ncbi:MAG TPA: sigma factor-like helix-turn-helix DNA-binding protein [Candidatus Saccharimonadales bacterium]|nr:sigma factor-like helix-turn-helix DNA-binding protein [Candidatus Saccharimonadales bacterium]
MEDDVTEFNLESTIQDILGTIEREREREIISRRFGLFDRRETLEQIGELLGITRERVRQLEKSVVNRLKSAAEADLPHIAEVERVLSSHLEDMGKVARISDVAARLSKNPTKIDQARVAFLASLAPGIAVIDDNDHFFHSIGLAAQHTEKAIRDQVGKIINTISEIGEPTTIDKVAVGVGNEDTKHVEALASISKNVASLHGRWGLTKWPMVNPKNIRDKIYVILHDNKKPMHFSEIAEAIKSSDLKRKDVTTQAIHNELIKDSRFVLIGRGIYALKEWGYKKGTVSDVIAEILRKEGGPLHRDEIVKRVLKSRHVKETTILLNLQGKPQFKRVAKATYELADTNA